MKNKDTPDTIESKKDSDRDQALSGSQNMSEAPTAKEKKTLDDFSSDSDDSDDTDSAAVSKYEPKASEEAPPASTAALPARDHGERKAREAQKETPPADLTSKGAEDHPSSRSLSEAPEAKKHGLDDVSSDSDDSDDNNGAAVNKYEPKASEEASPATTTALPTRHDPQLAADASRSSSGLASCQAVRRTHSGDRKGTTARSRTALANTGGGISASKAHSTQTERKKKQQQLAESTVEITSFHTIFSQHLTGDWNSFERNKLLATSLEDMQEKSLKAVQTIVEDMGREEKRIKPLDVGGVAGPHICLLCCWLAFPVHSPPE